MRIQVRAASAACIIVLSCGTIATAVAAESSPAPGAQGSGGSWTRERLAIASIPGSDDGLELVRYAIEPGVATPAMEQQGSRTAWVEAGTVSVLVHDGDASQLRGSGDEPTTIPPDIPWTLLPGQAFASEPGAVVSLRNAGDTPAIVLAAIVTADVDRSEVEVDPDATPLPTPDAPVVGRFTVTGPGATGDHYRITVVDRSGRVRGTRVPGEPELRFATSEDHEIDELVIGPLAWVRQNRRELLVRWGGTPCGPVVTVEVGSDLASIRVVDRTPGCDAAYQVHALVLELSGRWFDPDEVEGTRVRGR